MTIARQIGIAGLGLLGSALAHRLIGAGFTPKGYDIDAAKIAAFAKAGGVAATLDEVAHCDVVLLAVFDTDQVEDVVAERAAAGADAGHGQDRARRRAPAIRIASRRWPAKVAPRGLHTDRDAGVGIERAGEATATAPG